MKFEPITKTEYQMEHRKDSEYNGDKYVGVLFLNWVFVAIASYGGKAIIFSCLVKEWM